jgi:hypothetical protein
MLLPLIFAVLLGQTTYTVPNSGEVSMTSDGNGPLTVGYGRVLPDAGSTTPATVAILGQQLGGVLVNETGVPGTVTAQLSGRIYVEVNSTVTTGIAITNLGPSSESISFHMTNTNGFDVSQGSFILPGNQQISKLLTEPPFNAASSFQGTLTYTAGFPVAVTALRGHLNESNEFLWSTFPIADPSAVHQPAPATLVMPHFVDGQGWTTEIVLVNTTDLPITGSVQFFSQGSGASPGAPLTMTANGLTSNMFSYIIPRESTFTLTTSGVEPSGTALTGSVQVAAASGDDVPSMFSIFSFKNSSGTTVSEAAAAGTVAPAFRMYVEETSPTPGSSAIQSGFAVANTLSSPVTATLTLTALNGSPVATTTIPIPANGQIAKMLHDVFPNIAYPIQGVLSIRSSAATTSNSAAALALRVRYNERNDPLTTATTMTDETLTATGALTLPQFLNGGGWTTQLIFFSGSNGQSATGQVTFTQSNGSPLNVTLK